MADELANLVATSTMGTEESITILVRGQWVITPPEDGDIEEVKTIFVYEIDEEDWHQHSLITYNVECYQVSQGAK